MITTEHEHKEDEPAPPLTLVRKKPKYRSGADHVGLAEERRSKPQSEKQKVIDQNVESAIAKFIDDKPENIISELRHRDSEERYYDGNKEVFAGQQLQVDPPTPTVLPDRHWREGLVVMDAS